MIWALLALLGLLLGSFFNVLIHRVPRGESIVTPPSHCPRCRKRIQPYDNIPVLSFLLLRGRCRHCAKPIAWRYPVIEALTGLMFVAVFVRFGYSWMTPRGLVFVSLLLVLAMIDLEHQIIPFRLSLPGLAIVFGSSLLLGLPSFMDSLWGALAGAAFVAVSWVLWRYVLSSIFRRFGVDQKEGMGGGDLPFAAMIGSFLGLRSTVVALFAAVTAGVVVGLVLRYAGKSGKGQHLPFGPFLATGALVGMFLGPAISAWYLGFVLG